MQLTFQSSLLIESFPNKFPLGGGVGLLLSLWGFGALVNDSPFWVPVLLKSLPLGYRLALIFLYYVVLIISWPPPFVFFSLDRNFNIRVLELLLLSFFSEIFIVVVSFFVDFLDFQVFRLLGTGPLPNSKGTPRELNCQRSLLLSFTFLFLGQFPALL